NGEEISAAGLRLLAVTLTGDTAGQNREITNFQALAKGADGQNADSYNDILQQIGQAIQTTSDDPDVVLKSLGYQLVYGGGRFNNSLPMPNLVSLVGAQKAGVFLRQALLTPNVRLQFTHPNETSRLAQKLALELMDQLKTPQ